MLKIKNICRDLRPNGSCVLRGNYRFFCAFKQVFLSLKCNPGNAVFFRMGPFQSDLGQISRAEFEMMPNRDLIFALIVPCVFDSLKINSLFRVKHGFILLVFEASLPIGYNLAGL